MKVPFFLVLSSFHLVQGSDHFPAESPSDESELLIRDRRAVLYTTQWLWPKNETIKYGFNETGNAQHDASERDWIREMISQVAEHFCIKIEEKSEGFRDVLISRTPGCGAVTGWQGRNTTIDISLGSGCHSSVHHEFLHTLGLGHTQRRNDRDKYITVPESVVNYNPQGFAKLYPEHELHLTPPVSYDFKSIMHYSAWYNGEIAMMPYDLDYLPTMGMRISPSFSDYKQLNMLYKCGDHCPEYATLKCENGGYPHPKVCGKCVCHDFAYGNRCEKLIIKKMSEDYPLIFERVTSNQNSIYANSSIRSDYNQIQPLAFMAPFGRQLKVTIEDLVAPKGVMTDNAHCSEECGFRAFEFIDNKDGDLTMGGKLFCCASRKGEVFFTHSNILGFTGHVKKGHTGSITFRVEVHEPRSNATHTNAPVPEWKFPDEHFADNEPDVCEIV